MQLQIVGDLPHTRQNVYASSAQKGPFMPSQHWLRAAAIAGVAATAIVAHAQQAPSQVPPQITTPDRVESRIGTLAFRDGIPDAATIDRVYDHLDFARGVDS